MDRPFQFATTLIWLAVVAAGFGYGWRYETAEGAAAKVAKAPSEAKSLLSPRLPTIVMFVHPSCPCSQASLEQMAAVVERNPGRCKPVVVVVGGPGLSHLEASSNAILARKIPGGSVVFDASGVEARRLRAETSGQIFAFAADGTVRFRGGITESRGHFGPSAGTAALDAVLAGQEPKNATAPVYGCPIFEEVPRA